MKTRTYRVVGNHSVNGVEPGETFTASWSPEEEAYWVSAGHVEVVGKTSAKQAAEEAEPVQEPADPKEGDAG